MATSPESVRRPCLNVGCLGAAAITKIVWDALHSAGHVVTIVGCRDAARGKAFVEDCAAQIGVKDLPRIGSYDDVVTAEDVDVVYVALPVTQRDQWVKKCIVNNKHVVGEKPPAESADQLKQWIEGLHAKQLLYMDGTMLSHGQRVGRVVKAVEKLGPIRFIHAHMSTGGTEVFPESDIRRDPTLEPAGILGDMGWYCIRYILHLMGGRMPTEVRGRIVETGSKGGIEEFVGELTFEAEANGAPTVAQLFCSMDITDDWSLSVSTAGGVLKIPDFCHPFNEKKAGWTVTHVDMSSTACTSKVTQTIENYSAEEQTETQRVNMWNNIGAIMTPTGKDKCDASGPRFTANPELSQNWALLAWKTQAIVDKLHESAKQYAAEHP